jgi:hypothetical protein
MSIVVQDDGMRYREFGKSALVKLCNAKLNNRQCNSVAVSGRDFCIRHGGRMPLGPDHGKFLTGLHGTQRKRFSSIGKELLTRINELREDPELFSLKDDTAYITAIIDRRAEAAEHGLSASLLRDMKDAYQEANKAYKKGDLPAFDENFKVLGEMLIDGCTTTRAEDEVLDLIGKRVEIVEAEQRMTHAKAYTLEVDQAYSLINQILGVIKKNVRDADELQAIKAGFGNILKTYKSADDADIIDAEVVNEED